jgi:8-oxo-dGTP diphosphatase
VADAPTRGAAAVIFDREGRVLLIKENYDRRRWSLPGGAVEDGESLEETAIRETLEETELVVAIEHRIGSYELADGFTVAAFRCAIVSGVPRVPSTDEIAEIEWCNPAQLPEPKSNVLDYAVPDALAGRRDVIRTNLPRIN